MMGLKRSMAPAESAVPLSLANSNASPASSVAACAGATARQATSCAAGSAVHRPVV